MKQLYIEENQGTITAALVQDGRLEEIFINKEKSLVGNIIVGRIATIMPGQFAFVDIGESKNAFMNLSVNHGLKSGQPVLVQVQKDAIGTKGAYVSEEITLKGRYVVLHKTPEVGVSHKITNEKEKRRLKQLVRELLPKGCGAIVRTDATGQTKENVAAEIHELATLYENILEQAAYAKPPAKIYPKINSIEQIMNDLLTKTVTEVLVNGGEKFLTEVAKLGINAKPFTDNLLAIFKKQIKAALEKVVHLPSGGYITIEQTEACAVIDVNTGSSASNYYYRDTVLKTNLEAAEEIIKQIILRNLCGLIIIDFIDMTKAEDKEKLINTLTFCAKQDRLNPEISDISKFGIVQIARPKRRLPLSFLLEETCPTCGGKGKISPHKNIPKPKDN